jgi:prepilin-type N-terminal cleavage/methylation domain-containing protein
VFARLRARLAQEDGMTLIELLTTMSILGVVITGILVMFVSGLRATTDLNTRFQAQQNARLALSSLRNEIGAACSVTIGNVSSPLEGSGSQMKLVIADPAGGANACSSNTTTVFWCAASASGAAPFGLYRSTAATCSSTSGVQRAGSLKCAGLPLTGCTSAVFARNTPASTTRPTVTVTFPVEANLTNTHGLYTLSDTITARNAGVGS